MSVTPSGCLSLPLYRLQTLICNSASFRTWVGAATVAAARSRCYLVTGGAAPTRPCVIVGFTEEWRYERVGEPITWADQGSLSVLFQEDVSTANQAVSSDALFATTNTVGAILTEVMELAGTSDYLNVHTIAFEIAPPLRSGKDESEDAIWMGFRFYWRAF